MDAHARRARNLETVRQLSEGDRALDRLSLLADDCVWWNGWGEAG